MSLYSTPPFANLTEEERRRRHIVSMLVMGAAPPGSTTPDPLANVSFYAPLTNTLVPTKAGNSTFTFTRATTAYVSDQDGILRQASNNEARFQGARRVRNWATFSQALTNAAWTKPTSSVTGGVTGPTGLADAFTVTATAASGLIYQQVLPPAGSRCCISWWLRRRTGTGSVTIRSPDGVAEIDVTAQLDGTWRRFATPAVISHPTPYVVLTLAVSGDAVDATYAQFEEVSGQSNQAPGDYVSSGVLAAPYHGNAIDGVKYFATTNGNSVAGNIVTDAQGTLIPTATLLGYVAENAATNLCLQSQTFDVTPTTWKLDLTTVTANTQTAPDGTLTADTMTDAVGVNSHSVYQQAITVTAASYTVSVYLKAGTLPWAQVLFNDGVQKWCNFNLSTGATGFKSAGVTGLAVALPNGWYRCSITFTATATAAGLIQLCGILSDANFAAPVYSGTGTGTMYLWGAQVEQSADCSTYIPTTTVAVTRNVDSLTYPVLTNIDGALATTYAECSFFAATPAAHQVALSTSAGGFYPQYYTNVAHTFGNYNNAATPATANARVMGALNKGATAWSGATVSLALNGGAAASGAFTAYATSGSIAVGASGASALQGAIRNVKFFSTRLTDPELIALTT